MADLLIFVQSILVVALLDDTSTLFKDNRKRLAKSDLQILIDLFGNLFLQFGTPRRCRPLLGGSPF